MGSTVNYSLTTQRNLNTTEWDLQRSVTSAQKYLEAIVLIVIAVVGSLHNLVILVAGVITPKLRSKIHLYILNLAVTDFMTTTVVIPVYACALLTGSYPFGITGCRLCAGIAMQNVGVSLVTNFALAINRCLLTRRRNKLAETLTSNKAAVISICVTWLSIFVLFTLPLLAGMLQLKYNLPYNACIPSTQQLTHRTWLILYGLSYLLIICLPLVGSTVAYIIVLKRLRSMSRHSRRNPSSRRRFINTSQNLAIVFVTFVVCWVPDYIHALADPFYTKTPVWVTRALLYLCFLNSVFNPFIFAWRFPAFRTAIKRMTQKRRQRSRSFAIGHSSRSSRSLKPINLTVVSRQNSHSSSFLQTSSH